MKRVFISYSFEDQEARQLARFLHDHLPSLGAEAVDATNSLLAGQNIQETVAEQINQSAMVVCFVRRGNSNVMFELGYALGKNKKIVLVGDLRDLPYDVRSMVYMPGNCSPFDLLAQVEKHLSLQHERKPFGGLSPSNSIENLKILVAQPDLVDNLEGKEFEELVACWFRMRGYEVERETTFGNWRFDFVVSPFRDDRAAVEVKKFRSSSQVPVGVVRQLLEAMSVAHLRSCILVSSAPFTQSALYFASESTPSLLLWTLEDLVEMNQMPNEAIERRVMSAKSVVLVPQTVNVEEIIRSVLRMYEGRAAQRSIKLQLLSQPLEPVVLAPEALGVVISNLIDNAIRYSYDDRVVEVKLQPSLEGFDIHITNYGVGFAPSELPNIWEPFYRGSFATERIVGMGLGLYVAEHLVAKMGGHLQVASSRAGNETTLGVWQVRFTVHLPRETRAEQVKGRQ